MTYIIEKTEVRITADLLFKRIESQRKELGITQEQMADALGITIKTYYNWTNNGTSQKNVNRIETVLNNWNQHNKGQL
jgi:transcriptional regulator with XRE-family HTH domain